MRRLARQLCDEAEQLGYRHERTNSRGHLVYVHASGHEVHISPAVDEDQARAASKAMRKACGQQQTVPKRNATAVKERQRRRHELDAERITAERRERQAERDAILARKEHAPLTGVDREDLRLVDERLAELHQLESLMKATPGSGHHQGRVAHTAGHR